LGAAIFLRLPIDCAVFAFQLIFREKENSMAAPGIALQRLYYQRLSHQKFKTPGEAATWLGAVQAQNYLAALWGIGLRVEKATEKTVEQAIADKTIVRIWFMRGTIHILPGADVRWMLDLLSPRIRKLIDNISRRSQIGLDEAVFARSNAVLIQALEGGKQLTRAELAAALEQTGISTEGMRLMFMLQRAQADKLLCQSVRRGKQPTFTLLDEWLPSAKKMERDEALAELTRRYFTSHGPATVQDFVWWSGLTVSDARAGLEAVKSQLFRETIDGQTYWRSPSVLVAQNTPPTTHLLPNYDEFLVGYKDRSASMKRLQVDLWTRDNNIFNPTFVRDGQILGLWKRTFKNGAVVVESRPFNPLTAAENEAFAAAAQRYGEFLNLPVALV
jgi:hypothetical protein